MIAELIGEQYKGKESLLKPNVHALQLGRDYALAKLACPSGLRVQRADAVGDRIFIEGNNAAALGCVYGGATVAAWYPITPSSSMADAFQRHCKRFRHCTSGPGISLMQEFIGLAYFAEIPAVIFDVQRGGPSTGMPTRTQQSDVLSCAYASHGDTKHPLLFPDDAKESFEFAALSFDLADRLQTPVFVMLDLDIGMNERLTDPLVWDDINALQGGETGAG